MKNVRPRRLPAVPGVSTFAEFNVRTYVIKDGQAGVFPDLGCKEFDHVHPRTTFTVLLIAMRKPRSSAMEIPCNGNHVVQAMSRIARHIERKGSMQSAEAGSLEHFLRTLLPVY